MCRRPAENLIAVDIGNARIKLGAFRTATDVGEGLPVPVATLPLLGAPLSGAPLAGDCVELEHIEPWLAKMFSSTPSDGCRWWIGSVNRASASRLVDWLRTHRPDDSITLLAAGDLPLEVRLSRPDMVGVDRLIDAVAANRLRTPDRPAVVVDVGTAITVDAIAADGAFLGGAILPGIAMAARALHDYTDLLPLLNMAELTSPPPALGDCTEAAMQSGLFYGAVGAIRELVGRMAEDATPEVFLTGGAGPAVASLLGADAHHVPHLTLAGIAVVAGQIGNRKTENGKRKARD